MLKSNRILNNLFSNWVNFFLNIVVAFFLAPFVVKSLGNVYYGIWVIMMQFTSYLYLMDFGVRESIIRYVSKYGAESESSDRTDVNAYICSAVVLYSAIGILCLIVALLLATSFQNIFQIPEDAISDARIVVIVSGITLSQFFIFNVYIGILMGLQRYDIFNKIGIITTLVRAAVIVYFLSQGYGIVALAFIQLAMGLINNVFVYFFAKKLMVKNDIPYKFKYLSIRKNKDTYKNIFNYSIFVLINNIGQKAIFHTDAIIIGIFMPAASVTFYAIAGTLVDYLVKFCNIGAQIINPMASELDTKDDKSRLREVLYSGSKLALIVSLPIISVYIFMGGNFIRLWMGEEYASLSGSILMILAFMQLYSLPHYTLSSILYGISKHHLIAFLRIIEAVFNVTLSIILLHYIELHGVALGTAIPHLISVIIILPMIMRRLLNIDLMHFYSNTYVFPIIATIPFAISCYYVDLYFSPDSLLVFFSQIAVLMPIYIIPCYFIAFNKDERVIYKNSLLGFITKRQSQ